MLKKILDGLQKFPNNNLFMLILFVVFGSAICIVNQFDFGWDFANYHYYNAFAFLNNRMNYDIVPASVNTFFNPLPDLPLYYLIQWFNDYPAIVYGAQGVWFGLLLFAFYKFSNLFFDIRSIQGGVCIAVAVMIAATGQATWFQAGSCTNEIPVAFFTFISLYMLFKQIKFPETQNIYKYFGAGFILGCALGLKSTCIFLCLSSGLSLLFCYKYLQRPLLFISVFALGGLMGYLLTNGWWLYKMWKLYENPFFPFLNGVFHSPYFDDFNFTDKRFIPPLNKVLIFPYIWLNGRYMTAEIFFYDLRGMIFYTLAWLFLIYMLIKPKRLVNLYKDSQIWFFYMVFMLLSYILWLALFSIYRYFVVVEMAAAIFLVKLLFSLKPKTNLIFIVYFSVAVIVAGILISNVKHGLGWARIGGNKVVAMEDIRLPENTLLKLYNFPTAFVVPILAEKYQFRALGYKHLNVRLMKGSDFVERGKFREMRDEIEKQHTGTVVTIFYYSKLMSDEDILDATGGKCCKQLKNTIKQGAYICVPHNLKDEIFVEGGECLK